MVLTDVRVLDSITQPDETESGSVVVAGSHGGEYAGYLAAKAGVRAVVLNDAGVGKDLAGIGSLALLDDVDCAAATVSHATARIGDGMDCLREGRISYVNETAAELGCRPGTTTFDCVRRLCDATPPESVPSLGSNRYKLVDGDVPVWGMDSLSLIQPSDAGCVVVTGSHGACLAGETNSYVRTDVAGAVFNDAGGGKDGAGTSRLPVLGGHGVPAATVDASTAGIGDGRSTWTGKLSAVNEPARSLGVEREMDCEAFAEHVRGEPVR